MDNAHKFFEGLKSHLSEQTNSAMVCRVERFDARLMKADVLPLIKSGDGDKPSMLVGVPVSLFRAGGFIIRPPYKKGDIVLVAFVDRDMDNFLLSGKQSMPSTKRTHSLDDAVVIGSVVPFTDTLPSNHSNDLVIGTEGFRSKLVMRSDGSILIEGDSVTISGSNRTESW